jgi:hypothetical protein
MNRFSDFDFLLVRKALSALLFSVGREIWRDSPNHFVLFSLTVEIYRGDFPSPTLPPFSFFFRFSSSVTTSFFACRNFPFLFLFKLSSASFLQQLFLSPISSPSLFLFSPCFYPSPSFFIFIFTMPFTYHSHSGEFCGHANGKLEEAVLRAIELGFTHFGMSEHMPRFREQDLYDWEVELGITTKVS